MEHNIGAFLRSRRARVRPEAAGLRVMGRRRVPGLRREELAHLAQISIDYYIQLERGRSPGVSNSVLDAIADALHLNQSERDHLRSLARPDKTDGDRSPIPQIVRPGLLRLLEMLDGVPAVVIGRRGDVLVCNRLGGVLLGHSGNESLNILRTLFESTDASEAFPDWEGIAGDTVACLADEAARHPGDSQLADLVAKLSNTNSDFRRLWARHDIPEHGYGTITIRHPTVDLLTLEYSTMTFPDEADQRLITYTAAAGSTSEHRLRLLGLASVSAS